MRIIFCIILVLMVPTFLCANQDPLQSSILEVIARIPSSPSAPRKSNGIFFNLGTESYLVTVGHEFEFTSSAIELVSNSGERLHGTLQANDYDETDPGGTDIAIVKVSNLGSFSPNYLWQNGSLIERFALPGTKVRIYNGRETIDGYEITQPPSPTTVNLRSPFQGHVLQGISGSIVAYKGLVIGLVRDVSPDGLIQVIRIDVVSRYLEKSLSPLPCGDAIVLANWAEDALDEGDFDRANGLLADAKAVLENAHGDNARVYADVKLTRARYEISQGLVYDADQDLESLLPVYTSVGDWRQQARTQILIGKAAAFAGYRFRTPSTGNLPGQPNTDGYAKSLQSAVDHFQSAVDLLRSKNEPVLLAQSLIGHAVALPDSEYLASLRESREALAICRTISPLEAVRAAYHITAIQAALGFPSQDEVALAANLATGLSEREQAEAYQENWEQVGRAIEIYRRAGSPFELAIAYERAGDMARNQDASVDFYRKAFEIFKTDYRWQWFRTRCSMKAAAIKPGLSLETYSR